MPTGTPNAPVVPKGIVLPDAVTGAEAIADMQSHEAMRAYFAAQKKVMIRVREDQWVQVNGYTFIIKAGEKVEVPEGIYDILDEAGRL